MSRDARLFTVGEGIRFFFSLLFLLVALFCWTCSFFILRGDVALAAFTAGVWWMVPTILLGGFTLTDWQIRRGK